ncbi:MAG: hypothetical protein VW518_02700, partial [Burkholderiaceae bacterium]
YGRCHGARGRYGSTVVLINMLVGTFTVLNVMHLVRCFILHGLPYDAETVGTVLIDTVGTPYELRKKLNVAKGGKVNE